MKEHSSQSKPRLISSIHWRAPEYLYKKKNTLWYAGVGGFFFACLAIFLLVKFWFAASIVALAFWLFLSYAEKRPEIVEYRIDKNGITIGDKVIAYSEIHSFTVEVTKDASLVSIETNYPLSMPITLVTKQSDLDEILTLLSQYIPYRQGFSFFRWINRLLHY